MYTYLRIYTTVKEDVNCEKNNKENLLAISFWKERDDATFFVVYNSTTTVQTVQTAVKKNLMDCTIFTDSKATCITLETAKEELYVDQIINRILFNLVLTQSKILVM